MAQPPWAGAPLLTSKEQPNEELGTTFVFRNNLSVLAEDEMNGTMRNNNRRTKRTESFV